MRALAQQAPPPPATVGELVVTATRRSESVLKIPYNISAISGADLARNGITSLAGIRNEVAGLLRTDVMSATGPVFEVNMDVEKESATAM